MIIDLNEDSISYDNYVSEYKIKSSKLLTEVNRINISMENRYNYIIIPMCIYNIIEQSEYFSPSLYENNDNDLRLVGWLGEFECYLDIHLEPWQILLSWDKSTTRDIKLNNILSDCIEVEKEKKIKVIP